jgi:hypothetical protein
MHSDRPILVPELHGALFDFKAVPTIAGLQAEALLSVLDGHVYSWRNKSVDGLAVAELWVDVTFAEELAGT